MADIIYEQPLNERMRVLLRLEHLFEQLNYHLKGDTSWDNRKTITSIIDILNLFERADLKTELIKEIDRLTLALKKLQQQPSVDEQKLQQTLDDLAASHNAIHAIPGRLGDSLRNEELINTVKQRITIPGGSCSFDLPALHHWLLQPEHERKAELLKWADEFKSIEDAVTLLLELVRSSAYQEQVNAQRGFYEKAFESQGACQLVQVKLHSSSVFPEVSGGRQRISIRFLNTTPDNKPAQANDDVEFQLACCVI